MKLQSQATKRFEKEELQRLVESSRPPHARASIPLVWCFAAGALVGAIIAVLWSTYQ